MLNNQPFFENGSLMKIGVENHNLLWLKKYQDFATQNWNELKKQRCVKNEWIADA